MQPVQRQATVMFSSLLGEAVPFEFLVAASSDADAEVRVLVCIALEGLANRANPDWLIPLLSDSDFEVRYYAEEALLSYGNRVPLKPVLDALVERGVDFEDPLVEALGKFKEQFPRSVLEDLVESEGEVAAAILGELGSAAPVDLLDTLLAVPAGESTRRLRVEALEAAKKVRNPQLAPRLAAIVRDEHDFSRFWAAGALGAIGDPQYMSEILGLLPMADRLSLDGVAEGLSGYGEQMPVEEMVEFIGAYPGDGNIGISDLILALQLAGQHTPYEFLLSYVQDTGRDPEVRGDAAEVLGSFVGSGVATTRQGDVALHTLVELLKAESDPIFRYKLASSLGFIKDARVLESLASTASAPDEDSFVATGAAEGLYNLATAGMHAPVEMWKTVLDHSADMQRKYAIMSLGLRDDAPSQLLLNYFADPHLKELVHKELLVHPPPDVFDLAQTHLAMLAREDSDWLSLAARRALTSLEGASSK